MLTAKEMKKRQSTIIKGQLNTEKKPRSSGDKMDWYEELDFDENPFDTNPKRFADKLVGVEELLEEAHYRVAAGSLLFIEGKPGTGKTSILWNLIKKHRGKIIYFDCEQLERTLNIEKLIVSRHGLIGRFFKRKPKNLILLLDNVSELSKKNSERVKYFFDQGYLLSAVFTGTNFQNVNFSQSLKERIGTRVVKTPELEPYQAVTLVRNRIGKLDKIEDTLIEELFKSSSRNPLKLLQNLDKLFTYSVENNEKQITEKILKKVVGG